MCTVAVNELCCAGDYLTQEPDQEQLDYLFDEQRPARPCNSSFGVILKGMSTLLAIGMAVWRPE
jgi:hypothetical protein